MTGSEHKVRLGVDLGGTKISCIALDATGTVRAHDRVATPHGDYNATCGAVSDLVRTVAATANCDPDCPVGVGCPGAPSPATGRIRNANSQCLNGSALQRDLENGMNRPVRLANDADCFALSEATDGAGDCAANVWGIILGTGVGSGLVINGTLLSGPRAIAGEWGHNPLPWPTSLEQQMAPRCWCGATGCIESWVSGPALADDHSRHGGSLCSAAEIADQARQDDQNAQATLLRHLSRLGRAMASVINILDPDVIVLGGGLGQMDHLYTDLPTVIAPYLFSDVRDVTLRKPIWGDDSGVRGAARLWDHTSD